MKAFRFRLESVLGVRRFEDERAQLARGAAQHTLSGAEHDHASQRQGVLAAADDVAGRLAEGVLAGVARSAAARLAQLGASVADAGAVVEQARAGLDECRREAREARMRLRALEKLRARAEAAHRREALARAQAELDEMASLRGRRGR